MHREPVPRDLVMLPGETLPEIVIGVSAERLTLRPITPGESPREVAHPGARALTLCGYARAPR